MSKKNTRSPNDVLFRACLIAAVLLAVLVPRLGANAAVDGVATEPIAVGCGEPSLWDGLDPLIEDPTGDIEALWATSDPPGNLTESSALFVRVDVKPGVPVHRLLIDTDGDRMTGMWTAQSQLSDAGWDRLVDPAGVLYRHAAAHPNKWDWASVKSKDLVTTFKHNRYEFCIPLSDLPTTERVYLAVETGWNSMPMAFLSGAAYPALGSALAPQPVRKPKRMAFYYSGSPWIVRECTDYDPGAVECAANVFKKFRHVVFGARLEEETRGGHEGATNLMKRLREVAPRTELWGYISFIGAQKNPDGTRDEVYEVGDYVERAKAWKQMGATGIFLDEYDVCDPSWQKCRPGPDGEGVLLTRQRQIDIVSAIHSLGLAVFANSHSVQNALGELDGVPSPLEGAKEGHPADMYLLENPTVVNGHYQSGIDYAGSQARFAQAVRLTHETGARLGVLDSMPDAIPDSAYTWEEYRVGWWQAAMAGAAAYAFHGDGLAILKPPVDSVGGGGLRFDDEGIRFAANGWETLRTVIDCSGVERGVFLRERVTAAGDSVVGFIPAAAATPGNCRAN